MPDVTIYRVRRSIKAGSASWGDWKLFENFDDFEQHVYETLIDVEVNASYRKPEWRKYSTWKDGTLGKNQNTATELVAAEKLVDGQWKELKVEITPPQLVWTTMEEES